MNNQKGFTLIELIVVIVILGILSAVAVPKFVDMRTDAERSVASATLGAAKSAISLNHSKKLVNSDPTTYPAYDATNCIAGLINDGRCLQNSLDEIPEGWLVDSAGGANNEGIFSPQRANGTAATSVANAQYSIIIETFETTAIKAVIVKGGTEVAAGNW